MPSSKRVQEYQRRRDQLSSKSTERITNSPPFHAAGSALPYKRAAPRWLKITADEVSDHIFKLARKGLTPSQIGVVLRDSHGVAQVKSVTGNKILRILKKNGEPFFYHSLDGLNAFGMRWDGYYALHGTRGVEREGRIE